MMTLGEWDVLTRAAALQLAHERIVGTDRTLPVKIEAVRAAKDAEIERIVRSATEAEIAIVPKDIDRLYEPVPEVKRLREEMAVLVIARYAAQRKEL
jgi:hypothetical protein